MATSLLCWRDARADDREALKCFECTERAKRSPLQGWKREHPSEWERRVEAMVRNTRVPCRAPEHLLLGFDDAGLAAASLFKEQDGTKLVELTYMAIALRWRHQGGDCAAEMAAKTWEQIEALAIEQEVREVRLVAQVDEQNKASQNLCGSMGLWHQTMGEPGIQIWTATQPIGDVLEP